MTVERVRVGDVLRLERRAVTIDPTAQYHEIGVRSFGKGIFHKDPVAGVELGHKRVFRVAPGDLVISNVFAWEGAVALASEAETGKVGSHRFMTFVPRDGRIDTAWASWFFQSEPGLELIRRASPGSAGRNRTLAIERFENLEIPLPPIDEQRQVVRQLTHLERAVTSLDTFGRRSRSQAEAARAALTGGTLGKASSWRRTELSEVLSYRCDQIQVAPEDVYHMAGVYSFGRGLFARADLEGSRTSYKILHRLHAHQLVMSRLKAWEGALAIVRPQFDGYFLSPEFPTFDINRDVAVPTFLGALLTSESFWMQLRGASKGMGARKQRVHADRLLRQQVSLPPLDEQHRRAAAVEHLEGLESSWASRSARVASLIPAALNRVFGGFS